MCRQKAARVPADMHGIVVLFHDLASAPDRIVNDEF